MKFAYDPEANEMVVRFTAAEVNFCDAMLAIATMVSPSAEMIHFYNEHWNGDSHVAALADVPSEKMASEDRELDSIVTLNMIGARYGAEFEFVDDGTIPND